MSNTINIDKDSLVSLCNDLKKIAEDINKTKLRYKCLTESQACIRLCIAYMSLIYIVDKLKLDYLWEDDYKQEEI